jgi:hypothetical protein
MVRHLTTDLLTDLFSDVRIEMKNSPLSVLHSLWYLCSPERLKSSVPTHGFVRPVSQTAFATIEAWGALPLNPGLFGPFL